jgi:hypothetical protein
MWGTGCVSDISHNLRYPTDYVVGGIYRLKQPVFAEKAYSKFLGTYGPYISLTLSKTFGYHYGMVPLSVADYERSPGKWPRIVGVAKPGTLIEITKIELENHLENGPMIWVRGRLLNLDWAKKTADLKFISKHVFCRGLFNHLPVVNTDILELVTKP